MLTDEQMSYCLDLIQLHSPEHAIREALRLAEQNPVATPVELQPMWSNNGKSAQSNQGLQGTERGRNSGDERSKGNGHQTRGIGSETAGKQDAGSTLGQHRGDGPANWVDGADQINRAADVFLGTEQNAAGQETPRGAELSDLQKSLPVPAAPDAYKQHGRVLYDTDAYCPQCGHNRDKSSVSTIDHGSFQECQRCQTTWSEIQLPLQKNRGASAAESAPDDMPQEPYLYRSCGSVYVDHRAYDALRAYAVRMQTENRQLRRHIELRASGHDPLTVQLRKRAEAAEKQCEIEAMRASMLFDEKNSLRERAEAIQTIAERAEHRANQLESDLQECKKDAARLREADVLEHYGGTDGERVWAQTASTWLRPGQSIMIVDDEPMAAIDRAMANAVVAPVAPPVLRLWVLEGVLKDYTNGIVCVLARDEVEAWAMLEKKDATAWSNLRGWPTKPDTRPLDELPTRFRCVDTPEAFVCWGGG